MICYSLLQIMIISRRCHSCFLPDIWQDINTHPYTSCIVTIMYVVLTYRLYKLVLFVTLRYCMSKIDLYTREIINKMSQTTTNYHSTIPIIANLML